MWDLIVLIPDHCLLIFFARVLIKKSKTLTARVSLPINQAFAWQRESALGRGSHFACKSGKYFEDESQFINKSSK